MTRVKSPKYESWSAKLFGRRLVSTLLTPAIAGIVLTILAPFGTDVFPLGWRAFYWVSLCLGGGLGAIAAHAIIVRLGGLARGWRHIVGQSLGSTIAVAPFVIVGFTNMSFASALLSLFYIWIIAIVITTFAELAGRKREDAGPDTTSRPALIDRLPMKLRSADLYAAMSEDHYVRLYTSAGEHLLLMRLGDVAGLAQPLVGLSPHRSWWVAQQGVADVNREDGKLIIFLKDGTRVPVSRAGAARVKSEGWFG